MERAGIRHPLARLLLSRLVQVLPVLLLLILSVFLLQVLLPGDTARAIAGPRASQEQVEVVRHQLGLDKSWAGQFWSYLTLLAEGDLGVSNRTGQPVSDIVRAGGMTTALLVVGGMTVNLLLAVPAALLLAYRPGSRLAGAITKILTVCLNAPTFWVGLMLSLFVGLRWGVLPVGGLEPGFTGHLRSLVLPSVAIALASFPVLARAMSASLARTLGSEHMLNARALGERRVRLFRRHVLRNSMPPVVTMIGLQFSGLLFGVVVVEQIFAVPGLGSAMMTAAAQRDFPVVRALTLLFGCGIIVANAFADVTVAALDPRTKWG